jgi:FeS assembly SUF system protein
MPTEAIGIAHTILTEQVIGVLRRVYDPELPVNIYDLGLVYDIEVEPQSGRVHIKMTLTAPGCPVAQTFPGTVECAVRELADVKEACVELVWEPPWDRTRMSEAARLTLGMLDAGGLTRPDTTSLDIVSGALHKRDLNDPESTTSDWVDVAAQDDLPEGSVSLVDVDGTEVAVFNIGGQFYAIEDVCTHDGGTLAEGEVQGFEIECPRHGARFDLRSGRVTAPPAYEDVTTFQVRIRDHRVQVREAGEDN